MPRRKSPDPIAQAVGARIRQLREERGVTAEAIAFGTESVSKGFLSDIEKGLARPSIETLQDIAESLGVALLDLVTFPDRDPRQALVDRTRHLQPGTVRRLLKEMSGSAPGSNATEMAANPSARKAVARPPSVLKVRKRRKAGGRSR